MSFEIERKFLVRSDAWRAQVTGQVVIRQAYLATDGKASVRIRIRDNSSATLTVKSRPSALRRLELEFPVSVLEAEKMIQLRHGAVIDKVRYLVPQADLTWEVDVFAGENAGLVIAEAVDAEGLPHVAVDRDLAHRRSPLRSPGNARPVVPDRRCIMHHRPRSNACIRPPSVNQGRFRLMHLLIQLYCINREGRSDRLRR